RPLQEERAEGRRCEALPQGVLARRRRALHRKGPREGHHDPHRAPPKPTDRPDASSSSRSSVTTSTEASIESLNIGRSNSSHSTTASPNAGTPSSCGASPTTSTLPRSGPAHLRPPRDQEHARSLSHPCSHRGCRAVSARRLQEEPNQAVPQGGTRSPDRNDHQ